MIFQFKTVSFFLEISHFVNIHHFLSEIYCHCGVVSWWKWKVVLSCMTLFNPMDCSQPGSSICGIFPGKYIGVGFFFLLLLRLNKCSAIQLGNVWFLRESMKFWYDWIASDKKKLADLLSENKSSGISLLLERKQVNQLSGYHEILDFFFPKESKDQENYPHYQEQNRIEKIILWHCFSNIAW